MYIVADTDGDMWVPDYGAIQNRDPEDRADSITIGLASSILSNRVSHFLNVNGPRYVLRNSRSQNLAAWGMVHPG
jgi:acyl transferase domain-containing protein